LWTILSLIAVTAEEDWTGWWGEVHREISRKRGLGLERLEPNEDLDLEKKRNICPEELSPIEDSVPGSGD